MEAERRIERYSIRDSPAHPIHVGKVLELRLSSIIAAAFRRGKLYWFVYANSHTLLYVALWSDLTVSRSDATLSFVQFEPDNFAVGRVTKYGTDVA